MKANELQIGDYVNYRGQIIKVTSLYNKGGSNEVGWSDKESVWVNADNVEPIPLTPEIFKKNGFKEGTYNILDKGGYKTFPEYKYINREEVTDMSKNLIKVSYSDVNGGVYDISFGIGSHIFDLKYVHELQHTLRLCGIEKTIEL